MHRRKFLKTLAAAGIGTLTPQLFQSRAWGLDQGNGTKLLLLNLNGGLDGLYALQPSTGSVFSTLSQMRSSLLLNPAALLPAGTAHGFHVNLTSFKSLYDEGKLLGVHKVGYKNMSRSHLDSEVAFARGVTDRLTASSSGFLNRLGAHYQWSSMRAVSVTGTDLAFEGGEYRGVQVRSLSDFFYRSPLQSSHDGRYLLDSGYSMAVDTQPEAGKNGQSDFLQNFKLSVDSTDAIRAAVQAHSVTQAYPATQFGRALKDIDVLFSSSSLGTQVGYMRVIGFDTHSRQQSVLDRLLLELNAAFGAFVTNMKARSIWDNLIVLIFSEFGRTNRENGSGGTDHGGANTIFLAGGAVNGGQVIGEILPADLNDYGWLPYQYNVVEVYRRVLARMGLDPDAVFPTSDGPALTSLFT